MKTCRVCVESLLQVLYAQSLITGIGHFSFKKKGGVLMGEDDEIREESSEDVAGGFDQRTDDYEGLARRLDDVMSRLDDVMRGIDELRDAVAVGIASESASDVVESAIVDAVDEVLDISTMDLL